MDQLQPEEQFRQPGAYEHHKKNWFAFHHLVAYALFGMLALAIVAFAYYWQVSQIQPLPPPVVHKVPTAKVTDTIGSASVSGHLTLVSCPPETLNKTCFPPQDPFEKFPVTVQAIQNGKIAKTAVADSNGNYSMQLDPGTYGIDRDWPGYNGAHSPIIITLAAGDSKTVNFSAGIGQ